MSNAEPVRIFCNIRAVANVSLPNPDNRIVGGGGGDCNYAELEPIGTMPSLARISYL